MSSIKEIMIKETLDTIALGDVNPSVPLRRFMHMFGAKATFESFDDNLINVHLRMILSIKTIDDLHFISELKDETLLVQDLRTLKSEKLISQDLHLRTWDIIFGILNPLNPFHKVELFAECIHSDNFCDAVYTWIYSVSDNLLLRELLLSSVAKRSWIHLFKVVVKFSEANTIHLATRNVDVTNKLQSLADPAGIRAGISILKDLEEETAGYIVLNVNNHYLTELWEKRSWTF